jgi:hypothetical protein
MFFKRMKTARIVVENGFYILKHNNAELYRHYEYVEVIRFAANAGYRVEI